MDEQQLANAIARALASMDRDRRHSRGYRGAPSAANGTRNGLEELEEFFAEFPKSPNGHADPDSGTPSLGPSVTAGGHYLADPEGDHRVGNSRGMVGGGLAHHQAHSHRQRLTCMELIWEQRNVWMIAIAVTPFAVFLALLRIFGAH